MKKALILSYYFPPVTGAASWRALSWAEHFKSFGIQPTMVTRHWTGNETRWEDFFVESKFSSEYKVFDSYDIYFLPSKNFFLQRFLYKYKWADKLFHKLIYWMLLVAGHLNIEVNAFKTFKMFLKEHLINHEYDFILITSPPNNIVRLIRHLPAFHKSKIIVDFRDIYNNASLRENYSPKFGERLSNSISRYYLKIWLERADLIITASDAFSKAMSELTKKNVLTIYNGFESELFERKTRNHSDKFNISIIGNIYDFQDLSLLLPGLNLFLKNKNVKNVQINLIGVDANPLAYNKFINALPSEFLFLSPRVSKEEAVKHTSDSHVLLYPCLRGHKGQMSVKLYDYMASGNPVIVAPPDNDIVEKIIIETNCGIIANTVEEVALHLEKWYQEWLETGTIKTEVNKTEIDKYSRRNQAGILVEALLKLN